MHTPQKLSQILTINKLKSVYRVTTVTNLDATSDEQKTRQESTAEHSWSAQMIFFILHDELVQAHGEIDSYKVQRMLLIHDLVEIFAGDVNFFDSAGRAEVKDSETDAIEKFVGTDSTSGEAIKKLWLEYEQGESIESKIALACDVMCPVIMTLMHKLSLKQFGVTRQKHDAKKMPYLAFSQPFVSLYELVADQMEQEGLFVVKGNG